MYLPVKSMKFVEKKKMSNIIKIVATTIILRYYQNRRKTNTL